MTGIVYVLHTSFVLSLGGYWLSKQEAEKGGGEVWGREEKGYFKIEFRTKQMNICEGRKERNYP